MPWAAWERLPSLTEAAHWWTRSGLFRDGACFLSFEQFASAERVVQVLGAYLEGPKFDQLPAAEQRRRVLEVFREKDRAYGLGQF